MSNLRKLVLQSFKRLHRTRMKVFNGDRTSLAAARLQINDEYKKNKHVSEDASVAAMIKFSDEIERELRTQVIQAKEIKPGVFEAKITQDTLKMDNIAYNDAAIPTEEEDTATATAGSRRTRPPARRPACQDRAPDK